MTIIVAPRLVSVGKPVPIVITMIRPPASTILTPGMVMCAITTIVVPRASQTAHLLAPNQYLDVITTKRRKVLLVLNYELRFVKGSYCQTK